MKRLFFFGFVLVWCVTAPVLAGAAKPWGILYDIEEVPFSVYGVDNLIDKRPIRYAVSEEVTPEQEQIFVQDILAWPQTVWKIIKKSGREKEFADIRDILHAAEVSKASPEEEPDISLVFSDKLTVEGALGIAWRKGQDGHAANLIEIKRNHPDFAKIALHELGHYFGLADQYELARLNAHEEYSSDVNKQKGAMMQGYFTPRRQMITCDDADGFINLIDLRLSQQHNGQFSTRAKNGWKSLCPNTKNIYKEARTINRNERDSLAVDAMEGTLMANRTYKDGRLTHTTYHATGGLQIFSITPQDTVKRDSHGRVTYVKSTLKALEIEDEQTEANESAVWERRFVYKPAMVHKGQIYLPIWITETLNGTPMRERKVLVYKNGTLTGDINCQLVYDGEDPHLYYFAGDESFKVVFELNGNQITQFLVENSDENIKIIGTEKDVSLYRAGFHVGSYLLPLQSSKIPLLDRRILLSYVNDIYQPQREYFQSYYKNFYEKLFPPAKPTAQAEQVKQQIQKAMQRRSR